MGLEPLHPNQKSARGHPCHRAAALNYHRHLHLAGRGLHTARESCAVPDEHITRPRPSPHLLWQPGCLGGGAEADFYGGGRFSAGCQFFGCQFFLLAFKGGAKNRPGRVPVQFSGLAVQFSGFARPIFLSTRPADLAGQFFGVFRFFNYTKISKEIKNWNSQK